jgi:hypothetical protein
LKELVKGGNLSDFWGRYAPEKRTPKYNAASGIIAWELLN